MCDKGGCKCSSLGYKKKNNKQKFKNLKPYKSQSTQRKIKEKTENLVGYD